jgi:hypothetical protein
MILYVSVSNILLTHIMIIIIPIPGIIPKTHYKDINAA